MTTTVVNSKKAYLLAYKALEDAVSLAVLKGTAEELANVALTCMELAGRLEPEEAEDKKKRKVGFAHDDE